MRQESAAVAIGQGGERIGELRASGFPISLATFACESGVGAPLSVATGMQARWSHEWLGGPRVQWFDAVFSPLTAIHDALPHNRRFFQPCLC